MILDFLTKLEKQYTMTQYYRSYSLKLTLFTFFTSAVVPLMCELINRSDGYEVLISNMLMMFLVNAFVTPIMWTMNFTYFLKKFRICLINCKKDPKDEDKNHNMTQRELNDLYELADMDISYKYSYLAKTLLMTFLYIPIFPLGIIISLLGFIFGYFLEKFNYCYMYKRPEMLNHRLCVFYVNHFDIILFVYSIGNYIFMNDVYNNKTISLVSIIIFGIITIIPYSKFLQKSFIGIKESDINHIKYEDQFIYFANDYDRANPITRMKGTKNYLEKLLSSNKITREKTNVILNQVKTLNLMDIYYENRKNKYIFDAQRNFARAAGRKFLNLPIKKENKKEIKISLRKENIEPFNQANNFNGVGYINISEENTEKEGDNNIVNIYNNPHFMDYGCMIQSYLNKIIENNENNENSINEENDLMIIDENNNEDDKDDKLFEDKIKIEGE